MSPYLVDEVRVGDQLELRGPIGGYFVWSKMRGGPLLLVAGGSGIVPLRCIMSQHDAVLSDAPLGLLYSVRAQNEIIYRHELDELTGHDGVDVFYTLTREWPDAWTGYRRRIDVDLLREVAWPADHAAARLHLRPYRFRRECRYGARRARLRARADQDREIRAEREHELLAEHLGISSRRSVAAFRRRALRSFGRCGSC